MPISYQRFSLGFAEANVPKTGVSALRDHAIEGSAKAEVRKSTASFTDAAADVLDSSVGVEI